MRFKIGDRVVFRNGEPVHPDYRGKLGTIIGLLDWRDLPYAVRIDGGDWTPISASEANMESAVLIELARIAHEDR